MTSVLNIETKNFAIQVGEEENQPGGNCVCSGLLISLVNDISRCLLLVIAATFDR